MELTSFFGCGIIKSMVERKILDQKVENYLAEVNQRQLGALVRNMKEYGINDLDKKALIIYLSVAAQTNEGIFPYNRYIKDGSNPLSDVVSPDEHTEKQCIVWCNNHYLGLNRHPKVIQYAHQILDKYGTGSGTSATSGGFNEIHKVLEKELAAFVNKPDAILYPTGFTTNLGAIGAMATPDDLIIVDRDSHASIIDGIKLSQAKFRVFKHNNPEHLEHILKTIDRTKFSNIIVVTESVFSMTGEEAPLLDYCQLKKKYGFYLFVDEAHAFGFYGKKGSGLAEKLQCSDQIDFLMSTLSKATASIGGFIASEKHFCCYIKFNSNSYMFQACLPPVDAAVSVAALKVIKEDKSIVKQLWDNTNLLRTQLQESGFDVGSSKSPIVPLYVSDEVKLAMLCKELYKNGIFTNWMTYPVVSKKCGRLRFIVTAKHTEQQITNTIEILRVLGKKIGII
jgi:8-amino-7-oxononanoate synthase